MAKTSQDAAAVAERVRLALDMYATGEALMRQRIRREHPDLSPVEVEARLCAWLQIRPGAEYGDAMGRPGTWPRMPRA
jgi:Rv0078B-related antitoxin